MTEWHIRLHVSLVVTYNTINHRLIDPHMYFLTCVCIFCIWFYSETSPSCNSESRTREIQEGICSNGMYSIILYPHLRGNPSNRSSVCHVLVSQNAPTSYKLTLGDWFGVSCCFVKRFKIFSGSFRGQIVGKNDLHFYTKKVPLTLTAILTFSKVDKSSIGIYFKVSIRLHGRKIQFCPGSHLKAEKWPPPPFFFFTKSQVSKTTTYFTVAECFY